MSTSRFRYATRTLAAAGLAVAPGFGCQSVQREYPGLDADSVWTALVATARSPDYETGPPRDRWTVRTNEVWEQPDGRRLEVYRQLVRIVHLPATDPRREERTWRFRITLREEQERQPVVRFTNRGWTVPTFVSEEAERYFDGVTELLSAPPPAGAGLLPFIPDESLDEGATPMPAAEPVPEPAAEPAPEPAAPPPAEEPAEDEVDPALLEILEKPG